MEQDNQTKATHHRGHEEHGEDQQKNLFLTPRFPRFPTTSLFKS